MLTGKGPPAASSCQAQHEAAFGYAVRARGWGVWTRLVSGPPPRALDPPRAATEGGLLSSDSQLQRAMRRLTLCPSDQTQWRAGGGASRIGVARRWGMGGLLPVSGRARGDGPAAAWEPTGSSLALHMRPEAPARDPGLRGGQGAAHHAPHPGRGPAWWLLQVAAKALETGVFGAYFNVLINLKDVTDDAFKAQVSRGSGGPTERPGGCPRGAFTDAGLRGPGQRVLEGGMCPSGEPLLRLPLVTRPGSWGPSIGGPEAFSRVLCGASLPSLPPSREALARAGSPGGRRGNSEQASPAVASASAFVVTSLLLWSE